jgi:hypothetical protein
LKFHCFKIIYKARHGGTCLVNPVLRRTRQEDQELQTNLGYLNLLLKKTYLHLKNFMNVYLNLIRNYHIYFKCHRYLILIIYNFLCLENISMYLMSSELPLFRFIFIIILMHMLLCYSLNQKIFETIWIFSLAALNSWLRSAQVAHNIKDICQQFKCAFKITDIVEFPFSKSYLPNKNLRKFEGFPLFLYEFSSLRAILLLPNTVRYKQWDLVLHAQWGE